MQYWLRTIGTVALVALAASVTIASRSREYVAEPLAAPVIQVIHNSTATHDEHTPQRVDAIPARYGPLGASIAATKHAELARLLVQREASKHDLVAAAEVERALSLLMTANEYSLYEQLRDADEAHASVMSFAEAVAAIAPLTEAQRHALLLARVAQEPERQRVLLQASLPRATPMETSYAQEQALHRSARLDAEYLDEARTFLSEAQWHELHRMFMSAETQ